MFSRNAQPVRIPQPSIVTILLLFPNLDISYSLHLSRKYYMIGKEF